jgi:ATP-binding cassette, subfamily C, bacterial
MSGLAPDTEGRRWRARAFPLYVSTLAEAMPGRLAVALGLTVLGALAEVIGLLALVPLLHLIGVDVQQGSVGRIARLVETAFGWVGLRPSLISVLVLYVGLIASFACLRRWQTVTYCALQVGFTAYLRKRLHRVVMRTSWLQLTRCRASDLTHAMTGQAERIGHGTHLVLRLALDGLITVVYLGATLYVSLPVTILVTSAGLVLVLLLRRKARAATTLGQAMTRLSGEAYHAVMEHLGGIKLAKGHGTTERSIQRFAELADTMAGTNLQAATVQADAKFRFDIGAALVLGVALYVAIAVLATPPAAILVLLFAFARVMPLASGFEQSAQQLRNMLPDFSAVLSLETRLVPHEEAGLTRRQPLFVRRAVRLDCIWFRYETAGEPALVDVSLTIPAGRTTAIVGPSGSGKTSLADLLLGLIVPERGRVLVDDTPLTPAVIPAWREHIGYVPQDTFLFHDTVRANLLWARPEAGEVELREALEGAAAGFVDSLPQGLDTVLGDRGVRLSGGERQRIALACALLRRPAVLILDEATSNLDSENERRVQDAIERLHGQLTILIITHRLTTIRSADSIHVLEGGRLVESGTWDALLNGSAGRFRSLCEAQGLVG